MPHEAKGLKSKPVKASRGLVDFFRPAIDSVAAMDPTGLLLEVLSGVKKAPEDLPTAVEGDYNFIPETPQLGDDLAGLGNRQNKIKQTFGKIPGRN